ncbi:hypothetical protein [Streptomyces violaceusniger]|uniref:hypothetical protein n=1 Tax=Streptomyces violaceusniger TaxID=68280 RepID=UPI0001E4D5BB
MAEYEERFTTVMMQSGLSNKMMARVMVCLLTTDSGSMTAAELVQRLMTHLNVDRESLRELADQGNETALDRLADLAEAAGDLDELSELLDEGSMHAGFLLTRRAAAAADLPELQRIADAGYDEAGNELDRLLKAPSDGHGACPGL